MGKKKVVESKNKLVENQIIKYVEDKKTEKDASINCGDERDEILCPLTDFVSNDNNKGLGNA